MRDRAHTVRVLDTARNAHGRARQSAKFLHMRARSAHARARTLPALGARFIPLPSLRGVKACAPASRPSPGPITNFSDRAEPDANQANLNSPKLSPCSTTTTTSQPGADRPGISTLHVAAPTYPDSSSHSGAATSTPTPKPSALGVPSPTNAEPTPSNTPNASATGEEHPNVNADSPDDNDATISRGTSRRETPPLPRHRPRAGRRPGPMGAHRIRTAKFWALLGGCAVQVHSNPFSRRRSQQNRLSRLERDDDRTRS